ncbi:L,D-transpeptidase Cds6 family protein [Helicobacter mustelae]|uniref:Putative periplasmic protein n=1 Tax=Helicobacter mustelae (strain ATCC 43772 / CCUG 25715 / CIP 103759 / LMG 18044 / NCTC 12198 / R85-136P) TaxID=679897 RepID=D3UHJ5_HELM1|nr:L,D-transpeptidase family protein [Helicobacter mustelae]CBG39967.1 putative periplasmic protein [Helicobacter mustelae 12198]SQH71480.1 conserved hypothetical secreted protein [Helicobacter mustelae]STP12607.1 conserved hypothetical secreted protein [Helicobacter mustelae]
MLKKLSLIFLLFSLGFSTENSLVEIVQNYRHNGIESTRQILDKVLEKESFWMEVLGNQDTDFGYYEGANFLFLFNKDNASLILYKIENGHLTQLQQTNAIMGIGGGAKQKKGDKVTPIGVYNFVELLEKLDPYYGPMAFATNYPNTYDNLLNRTGSGIWLHGLPLNGDRKDQNTKGCIAVENNLIQEFNKTIDYKKTLLLSYDKDLPKAEKKDLALILSMLYQWKDAWVHNDIKRYLGFYAPDFKKADGSSLAKFSAYKTRVFNKKEEKSIRFYDIDVVPYPNIEGKQLFRVTFLQHYTAYKNKSMTYNSKDSKELYVQIHDNKASIFIEK